MIPKRPFLFLRHGETEFNREGRYQGSIDIPLNDSGVAQATAAAGILSNQKFDRIISSPANRVLKTAAIVAEVTGKPMFIDGDLMELFVGNLEGRLIQDVKRERNVGPETSLIELLPDDAEQWVDFQPRVTSAVAKWLDRHPDETLLFASHGLVFRALTEHLFGERKVTGNAVPHKFGLAQESWHATELT